MGCLMEFYKFCFSVLVSMLQCSAVFTYFDASLINASGITLYDSTHSTIKVHVPYSYFLQD
jgi:hypothetical protein